MDFILFPDTSLFYYQNHFHFIFDHFPLSLFPPPLIVWVTFILWKEGEETLCLVGCVCVQVYRLELKSDPLNLDSGPASSWRIINTVDDSTSS